MPARTFPIGEGFPTTITLTDAGVTFWEKTVEPLVSDGGEPVNTTSMRNVKVRTFSPRHLYQVDPVEITALYDGSFYSTLQNTSSGINKNQQIVTTLPDGTTITWWGYIQKAKFDAMEEGKEPLVHLTLVHTGRNNSGTGA
jgi:hypothetical protein